MREYLNPGVVQSQANLSNWEGERLLAQKQIC